MQQADIYQHGGQWTLYVREDDAERHLMPNDDIGAHEPSESCQCCPVDDPTVPMPSFIHNSFDGREDFENGKRKVS